LCDILGKKDPGIPNRFPFKEEILKEAEKRKHQVGMMEYVTCYFWLQNIMKCSKSVRCVLVI